MILFIFLICIIIVVLSVFTFFNSQYKKDIANKGDKLWVDRKRNKIGLPWSFTKYSLSDNRIFIQRGFFNTTFDEVRLYRVLDVQMTMSLIQKIFKIGTVVIHSSDKSLGCFSLLNIKSPEETKELISKNVEIQRDKHRVYSRESIGDDKEEDDDYEDD